MEEKLEWSAMQFGRVYGISVVLLGIALLVFQLSFFMAPKKDVIALAQSTTAAEHRTNPLPGILGGSSLIGDIVMFATASRRDELDGENALK